VTSDPLFKTIGEIAAAGVSVLTAFKVIPAIAFILPVMWYLVGLYEKVTGRQFSESRLARWITRK